MCSRLLVAIKTAQVTQSSGEFFNRISLKLYFNLAGRKAEIQRERTGTHW